MYASDVHAFERTAPQIGPRFDSDPTDLTPILRSVIKEPVRNLYSGSQFTVLAAGVIDMLVGVAGLTPASLDHHVQRQYEPLVAQTAESVSAVERTAEDRRRLLARSYGAGDENREDESRLEILTARLRNLSPRVTHVEISNVEQLMNTIDLRRDAIEEIARQFDLK